MKTYIVVYWLYSGGYYTNIAFHAKNNEKAIKDFQWFSQAGWNREKNEWNREKCNLYSLETGEALAEHGEGQKNCWSFIPPKRKIVH